MITIKKEISFSERLKEIEDVIKKDIIIEDRDNKYIESNIKELKPQFRKKSKKSVKAFRDYL